MEEEREKEGSGGAVEETMRDVRACEMAVAQNRDILSLFMCYAYAPGVCECVVVQALLQE